LEDEEKDQDERERRPAETRQEPLEDGVPRDEVEVPEAEESDGYEPSIAPDQPEQLQIESMAEESERAESPQSRKRREEFEEGMRRSENLRRRTLKSSKFFKAKEDERKLKKTLSLKSLTMTESVRTSENAELPHFEDDEELPPIPMQEYDPDLDSYQQTVPTAGPPPIETRTAREEAEERAAKRLRITSPSRAGSPSRNREGAMFLSAEDVSEVMLSAASRQYAMKAEFYEAEGISEEDFLFGVERNIFDTQIQQMQEHAFAASNKQVPTAAQPAKKGRKEIRLQDLEVRLQEEFTSQDGSDAKEWQGWIDKKACDVLTVEESEEIRRSKPELIVPTRWVRTNKNEGVADADFKAKSRLVVQGFRDKALGRYRRDAPTASQIAESILLCVCSFYQFIMLCKDVKNGYFCGKPLDREVYLEQPRGGLPGLARRQLLRARKAIYGFAEAARLLACS